MKQVKSKERVSNFGEVFTNEREVKAMCDLVKNETENLESTVLEPACGDGNFLAEILTRKLSICKDRYKSQPDNYEKFSIVAVSSLYGVDILQDNVEICINRLYGIWENEYKSVCRKCLNEDTMKSCKYILAKNILCGDALTMLRNDGQPIVFAEWKLTNGIYLKRRDYELSKILENESLFVEEDEPTLFSLLEDDAKKDVMDSIDRPIKEYALIDYRRTFENE